ncbi:MAG: ABC transporter permease [Clostridiales bacterium]|jgi:ribose/xylose/arabinose/galactoside ABC-type transport system permease subunit|nr:ABC transporter permease [Clostridiales bacterium]
MRANSKAVFAKSSTIMILLFIALFIFFSVASRHFFAVGNIMNLFAQMVELGLLTLAMAVSMISGGMDLSIGTLCSFCTVLLAIFISQLALPAGIAIVLVLLIALLCGALNGFFVGYLHITPMLVTLGTQSLFLGLGLVVSKGVTVSIPIDQLAIFGRYKIGGVFPFQILLFIAAIIFSVILFNHSRTGRRIYLIGSDAEVARFAGIDIRNNLLFTYVFSSFMAFAAALVIASRISSGRADVASARILQTVCAAVFGGVSTLGGIGTIGGAMLGVAVITIVSNGIDMLQVSQFLQQIITGGMLLIVLAFRHARKNNLGIA